MKFARRNFAFILLMLCWLTDAAAAPTPFSRAIGALQRAGGQQFIFAEDHNIPYNIEVVAQMVVGVHRSGTQDMHFWGEIHHDNAEERDRFPQKLVRFTAGDAAYRDSVFFTKEMLFFFGAAAHVNPERFTETFTPGQERNGEFFAMLRDQPPPALHQLDFSSTKALSPVMEMLKQPGISIARMGSAHAYGEIREKNEVALFNISMEMHADYWTPPLSEVSQSLAFNIYARTLQYRPAFLVLDINQVNQHEAIDSQWRKETPGQGDRGPNILFELCARGYARLEFDIDEHRLAIFGPASFIPDMRKIVKRGPKGKVRLFCTKGGAASATATKEEL